MLVRYLLEKCKTTNEAINCLKKLPIASQQTLTIADKTGNIVVVECNSKDIEIMKPNQDGEFVASANEFNSQKLKKFNNYIVDNWRAQERYLIAYNSLKSNTKRFSFELAQNILAGKYGFMCQYDRKIGADTVWSVIYDIKNNKIFRVEGNPARKKFKEDKRLKFKE